MLLHSHQPYPHRKRRNIIGCPSIFAIAFGNYAGLQLSPDMILPAYGGFHIKVLTIVRACHGILCETIKYITRSCICRFAERVKYPGCLDHPDSLREPPPTSIRSVISSYLHEKPKHFYGRSSTWALQNRPGLVALHFRPFGGICPLDAHQSLTTVSKLPIIISEPICLLLIYEVNF
ncbi:hypothetical protein NEOLEDRAFT_1146104 [Neolentinus lepideus HHB14362 ss-1]|uniref:Uncharacterized protein n=1 Tax=Neolentinus lepideus HHB14362 ss-1 TaxID=1314782 RepID=A0A165UFT3_9AGAM|nr:hypothetical protein NEOLEDRAFT_1146104 [Neolentinus lepideus HHB14362 ss-1]